MSPTEIEMTVKLHKQVMQLLTNQVELAGILLTIATQAAPVVAADIQSKVRRIIDSTSKVL